MFDAYKGRINDPLLRAGGVALLFAGGLLLRWLFRSSGLRQHSDPSFAAFVAAALGFLCLSAGAILTTIGAHIFDRVEVSRRWARHPHPSSTGTRGAAPAAFLVVPDQDFIASLTRAAPDRSATRSASPPSRGGGDDARR